MVSDGGGAVIIANPAVARSLKRPLVKLIGAAEALKGMDGGQVDVTYTGAVWTGPRAFAEAGITPADTK